jgi:hypothetical protein
MTGAACSRHSCWLRPAYASHRERVRCAEFPDPGRRGRRLAREGRVLDREWATSEDRSVAERVGDRTDSRGSSERWSTSAPHCGLGARPAQRRHWIGSIAMPLRSRLGRRCGRHISARSSTVPQQQASTASPLRGGVMATPQRHWVIGDPISYCIQTLLCRNGEVVPQRPIDGAVSPDRASPGLRTCTGRMACLAAHTSTRRRPMSYVAITPGCPRVQTFLPCSRRRLRRRGRAVPDAGRLCCAGVCGLRPVPVAARPAGNAAPAVTPRTATQRRLVLS